MKKTQTNKLRFFLFFVIPMCLFLFNVSCGLDTVEVIEPPISSIRPQPEITSVDDVQDDINKEFVFTTNETATYSEINFLGTEIYYRIYNNISTMINERSALINASNTTSTSASSASKLINDYNYKKLKLPNDADLIIPKSNSNSNQTVTIRLSDVENSYEACVEVNGNYLKGTVEASKPMRYTAPVLTFNFGRDGDKDDVPSSGDSDFSYSSSGTNIYYVCLFAVGTGIDIYYSPQYSSICYLGTVTINSDSENN
ncbi:MAG: hypothetical protein J6X54_08950 [Treponema sp.]|nr:hypothetical protein [Treponema sp.]